MLGLCFLLDAAMGLTVPMSAATPATSLAGTVLARVGADEQLDIGDALAATPAGGKTLLMLGTHAGDFNTVEYAQRCRHFLPLLKESGVSRFMLVTNSDAAAASKLCELLDVPSEVELFADPTGEAGRAFGVSRGFRPDDDRFSPFAKLFFAGIGLGPPWMTLPAVLTGYFGNPSGRREWIETALKQGQLAGRWPSVLELSEDGGILANKFADAPLVGGWGRRPFELATLRLQNLIGVQGQNWDVLKPVDDRCLTQLGGLTVVGEGGDALYSWTDEGLCDVPEFYEILEAIRTRET